MAAGGGWGTVPQAGIPPPTCGTVPAVGNAGHDGPYTRRPRVLSDDLSSASLARRPLIQI